MKHKCRIVSAICVVILFAVGAALGSYLSDLKNLTDPNEKIEEDTPTERAIEAGNCDFCLTEKSSENVVIAVTPVQTSIPAPQTSPGIGTVAVLVALSAIYVSEKKR